MATKFILIWVVTFTKGAWFWAVFVRGLKGEKKHFETTTSASLRSYNFVGFQEITFTELYLVALLKLQPHYNSLLVRPFVFRKVEASDWWWTARDHGKSTDGRPLARRLLPVFLCAHIFIEREASGYEAAIIINPVVKMRPHPVAHPLSLFLGITCPPGGGGSYVRRTKYASTQLIGFRTTTTTTSFI